MIHDDIATEDAHENAPDPCEQAGGTRSEFEAHYVLTVPALVAWVRVRTSGLRRGAVDAEDVVQETWIRALESFARFDPQRASFRAWVLGIARHALLDAIRRSAGKPSAGRGHEMVSAISQCPASVTSISRAAARADGIAHFLAFVETLPAEDRDLVVMRGLEGREFEAIAQRQSISSDAAEKRWERLLGRLRERGVGRELVVDL